MMGREKGVLWMVVAVVVAHLLPFRSHYLADLLFPLPLCSPQSISNHIGTSHIIAGIPRS